MSYALDASAFGIANTNVLTGSVTSASFSASAGDIIVVHTSTTSTAAGNPTVTSITDNTGLSLTWAKRTALPVNAYSGEYDSMEIWWAYLPSAISSKTVTANWAAFTAGILNNMSIIVSCYSGFTGTAYETNPWDTNVSLPAGAVNAGATGGTLTTNTTSSSGILIAHYLAEYTSQPAPTGGPGSFSTIKVLDNTDSGQTTEIGAFYQTYSSAYSGSVSFDGAESYYADALTSPAGATDTLYPQACL